MKIKTLVDGSSRLAFFSDRECVRYDTLCSRVAIGLPNGRALLREQLEIALTCSNALCVCECPATVILRSTQNQQDQAFNFQCFAKFPFTRLLMDSRILIFLYF